MESCSICCFPYSEQQSLDGKSRVQKVLSCSHSLCKSCYLRLDKTICPFCRTSFNYTKDEINQRKLLDLNYNNWQPPSQINNYIPEPFVSNRRQRTNTVTLPVQNIQINEQQPVRVSEPFSRVRKNMVRNRRRNLDFEEVLERRKIIKKRCQKKWNRKNLRAEKELQSFTEGTIVN